MVELLLQCLHISYYAGGCGVVLVVSYGSVELPPSLEPCNAIADTSML